MKDTQGTEYRSPCHDRYCQQAYHPGRHAFSRNLAGTVNEIKTAGADVTVPMNMLKDTTALLSQTKLALAKLQEAADQAAAMENREENRQNIIMKLCLKIWKNREFRWISWR